MQFNPVHAHSPVPEFDSAATAVPPNPLHDPSPSDTSSQCAEGFLPARSFCCGWAHRRLCRQEEHGSVLSDSAADEAVAVPRYPAPGFPFLATWPIEAPSAPE